MTRLLISLVSMIVAVVLQLFLLYRSYMPVEQNNKKNRKWLLSGLLISIICLLMAVYYADLFPGD